MHKHPEECVSVDEDKWATCSRCGLTWCARSKLQPPSCVAPDVTMTIKGTDANEILIGQEFDKLANSGVDVNLWAAARGCALMEDENVIEVPEAIRPKIYAELLQANAGVVSREPEVSDDELATALDTAQTPVFATEERARDVARATLMPDTNPKTRMGALKIPLHLVPPSAMHALAIAFEDGARKYKPFNWRRDEVSSTVYYAALLRHVSAWFDGEDVAKDSGIEHLHHAMACLAILIDAKSVGKLNDDRPTAGASAKLQADYLGDVR